MLRTTTSRLRLFQAGNTRTIAAAVAARPRSIAVRGHNGALLGSHRLGAAAAAAPGRLALFESSWPSSPTFSAAAGFSTETPGGSSGAGEQRRPEEEEKLMGDLLWVFDGDAERASGQGI